MENKYSGRGITFETLEKAVSGDYNAMPIMDIAFHLYMTTGYYLKFNIILHPIWFFKPCFAR